MHTFGSLFPPSLCLGSLFDIFFLPGCACVHSVSIRQSSASLCQCSFLIRSHFPSRLAAIFDFTFLSSVSNQFPAAEKGPRPTMAPHSPESSCRAGGERWRIWEEGSRLCWVCTYHHKQCYFCSYTLVAQKKIALRMQMWELWCWGKKPNVIVRTRHGWQFRISIRDCTAGNTASCAHKTGCTITGACVCVRACKHKTGCALTGNIYLSIYICMYVHLRVCVLCDLLRI